MLCFMGAYLTLAGPVQGTVRVQAEAADEKRYAVAYVEVQSTAVNALRSAFDRYRTHSKTEDGFDNLELLQQSGNPGLFVIIERWRDQASIDAHATGAVTKRFRDALTAIRVSGYDERPYKDFAIGASAVASARPCSW